MDEQRGTDPVIFLEKVRRPVPRGLVRERLDRQLTAWSAGDWSATAWAPVSSAPQSPVRSDSYSCLLVLAPPGSGKTTLLSQLADRGDLPTGWYRAGAEDDSEAALVRHLGYAIGAALGESALVDAASSGVVADLLQGLERSPALRQGAMRLIVDDLHELAGSAAEAALETFIRLRPRRLLIGLGSRRQPGLNTSRLLLDGELGLIDGEALRFRSWEVEQLFRTVYDAPLAPEAAAALTRRTGGWAAGLQLFQLATTQLSRVDRERAATDLSGRSQLIRSYLARNVLDGLPAERRRFLLHTATLGVLTGELCDDLLNTYGSAALLAELEREQFFTTSSDGGLTYHYHQVLQTHLEVLLADELGGRAARELYARSGLLLEAAGRTVEAARAHARAEDWGAVARLLRPTAPPGVGGDELGRLLALPGAPSDDPGLLLAGARWLIRDGQISAAIDAYRRAEQLLEDPGFGRRCALERQAAAVWAPGSGNVPAPPMPGAERTDPESRRLRVSLELRRVTRDVSRPESFEANWLRALAYALAGESGSARRALVSAAPELREGSGWQPLAVELVGCFVDLLDSAANRGSGFAQAMQDVGRRVESVVLTAEVNGWPWLSRLAGSIHTVLLGVGRSGWESAVGAHLAGLARGTDRWTYLVAAIGAAAVGDKQTAAAAAGQAMTLADELAAPVVPALVRRLLAVEFATGDAALGAAGQAATAESERRLGRPEDEPASDERRGPALSLTKVAPGGATGAGETGRSGSLELRVLGGFSLAIGDREVGWRGLRPKARMLLMLLALHHGHPMHREVLIEELWPESTLSSGIRCLQVAVSSVRRCLTDSEAVGASVRRQSDTYELVLPGTRSDQAKFEHFAEEARRAESRAESLVLRVAALGCYQGELLPEAGPAEWVVEDRDRLRVLAATVAGLAAADAIAEGDLSLGCDLARRSLELDPCHDPAWRLLIEAYEDLGDPSAAAVARANQRRVWDDLGLVLH